MPTDLVFCCDDHAKAFTAAELRRSLIDKLGSFPLVLRRSCHVLLFRNFGSRALNDDRTAAPLARSARFRQCTPAPFTG